MRRLFRGLFGTDGIALHKWYVDKFVVKHKAIYNIINAIKCCPKGSAQRDAYLALLNASFTLGEIQDIIETYGELDEEIMARMNGKKVADQSICAAGDDGASGKETVSM